MATASHAATTSLCNSQTASVGGGTYIVQNNEWGSSAAECITTDGNADFTVANSSISNSTSGAPGGYPSIYQGCHWGSCSSGGLSSTPIQVSNLIPGKVTTSWSTTQPGGGNDYDVAYDIWFNSTSKTSGQPNAEELMIWLNHNGPVQPFGSQVATNVNIGGHTYNIWEGNQGWNTVSYTMTSGTTSVSNLDIAQLAQDSVSRGYMTGSDWLIDVEAGFELWQGGAGLATNSFSVNVNGSSSGGGNTVTVTSPGNQSGTAGSAASAQVRATDSASGQTLTYAATGLPPGLAINSATGLISGTPTTAGSYNVTVTARDGTGASGSASFTWNIGSASGGGGACTASYSILNSWSSGFQAQITVTAGSAGLSGWTVGWTFPGDQKISQMWNASYTQSGENVAASSMSYNGTLAAGASTTFGFTGTYASSDASPAGLSCT